MKKILVIAMAATLLAAFSIPASAVENEFGGYWRTRLISENDFAGTDTGSTTYVDTRTRLYYTAKFNENLKFVNKFEIDNFWGDNVGGDLGADGKGIFEIKNTYVDFSMANTNVKVGIHGETIARGFIFSEDFAGVTITQKMGNIVLPFMWVSVSDSALGDSADITYPDPNDPSITLGRSRDYLALSPVITVSDTLSVNPYFLYDKEQGTNTGAFYVGADVDAKIDAVSVWGSAIYQGGENNNIDNAGYLVAAGADAGIVHGQFFYGSGDDDATDTDNNAFIPPAGRSYYWSEIMGYGILDNDFSNNSPADGISNVMAVNVGTTLKPMDKLTLTGDVWYAQRVEDINVNGSMENSLGVEVDVVASYAIMDNLTLDVIAAYLFAGDATGTEDPMELGTQLSLSF